MSVKLSRPRKPKPKDDMKSEIVAQVHKTSKREISSDRETLRTEGSEESSGSNKTYVREDIKNDNCSIHNTPSRDISVDGDSQINSKIISLIEAEIKREVRHATFSDSRPQSLSFYEEEKMPEELSGNLELLSPEERKHYKRRKDYGPMDTDERNMYNSIQDIYNRENDDMITSGSLKKSKSRKKKHGDSEMGMGDSREMMIPKEKRKSKKKKHECSPMSGKRKHRKREEEFEPRNDITMALDDLQDDVFENGVDEFPGRHEKIRKSPRKGDKLYVQKKNKFELSTRDSSQMENHPIRQQFNRPIFTPLQSAIIVQKYWRKFTTFCHGLLGGLGFAHFIYISTNQFSTNPENLRNYAAYSDTYVILFYVLCILCLISVFDKYDIAHIDVESLKELLKSRKSCFVIIVYVATLILHLATTPTDDKIALVAQDFSYAYNITIEDLKIWNSLSFSRAFLAFMAWFFVSLTSSEDYLYLNLKSMEGGNAIPEIQSP